ncbi:hypothetical protein MLD38_018366 [Melastoma candidum]|uniref:Uncharacterized protein n=1 Tax=Melastoma candidum TaxID=119954 RepID=A0ACB9QUX0_9MYRT|nr:hypothetical protein MLD38_018366 [Melastoma candidum]
MLDFQQHIITDIIAGDGDSTSSSSSSSSSGSSSSLVILSSGLALPKLISALLHLHSPADGSILLLHSHSSSFPLILPDSTFDISSDLPAHARTSLYCSGGVLSITPRILIVDLLSERVPVSKIAGIVIPNVERITETSTEGFIVRVMKGRNGNVWVRAFSDKPHAMVAGFMKVERIMKCLGITRLHLWPRFQVYVSQELEKDPPVVVDVRVPMSKYMVGIQKAILEVMDACLKEMRKTNKVDVEDLTVENGLFKSFDEIVRMQLDPIWHTLGKKTKQLVSDLKTLRKLLDYLVRYDAVSYLKYLDTLRVSESFRSVWIFAESSYKIFELAKKRVYRYVRSDGTKLDDSSKNSTSRKRKSKGDDSNEEAGSGGYGLQNPASSIILEEVLEEAPKWKALRELLEEIEEERQKTTLPAGQLCDNGEENGCIVLVVCKDEHSCMQLQECILESPQKVMQAQWEQYLLSKVLLHDTQTRCKKRPKSAKGFGILDGIVPVTPTSSTEASSTSTQEHDALLAAASEIRKKAKADLAGKTSMPQIGTEGQGKVMNKRNKKPPRNNKSSQVRKHKNKASANKDQSMLPSEDDEQLGEVNEDISDNHSGDAVIDNAAAHLGPSGNNDRKTDDVEAIRTKPLPQVQFYALESHKSVLDVLKPSVIIVYHPDMTFVREIEVYKAENPLRNLKVYFLFYEDSTEGQKFEASIRRENKAFESLIRQKSLMIIPVNQGKLGAGSNFNLEQQASQNSLTRKAGGRKEAEKEMQIVVDMREFMSSLPNVLHQKGMRIIPVTLEVGDYVLSPLMCVERKSIQDLFSSFTSGRLYHQVEIMSRYYRIPVLLIEFSQEKSFSFQSASDIGDDVTPNNIISKLSLLVLHFPRLRILWSRSLHATADIFYSLKANQDEPDETKAIRVGVPSEEDMVDNDVRAENYNTSAVEFLRRLPGVTDSNYRAIMDGCKSLAELALLPLDRLAELMGGHKAARTLREFLDAKYPTLL